MNSKERVRAAVAGEPVDRIPLGFYVVDCDTVEKVIGRKTYVRNKIEFQLAIWDGRRDEVAESVKKDTVEFFQKIDCVDLLTFKEAPILPPKNYEPEAPRQIDKETWEDKRGRVYKASWLSNEIICVHDPDKKDVDDFNEEMFSIPEEGSIAPPDPTIFEAVDYLIEHLGPERYIAGSSGGLVAFTLLGSQETGLMLYALKPEVIEAANRAATASANMRDAFMIRPGQDGVLFEQDMAGTNGPMASPRQFRQLSLPYMIERVASVKNHGQQVLLHNCGDNRPLMDMFIEAGVDCYQSLQTNAGMSVEYLQETYGRSMSFWGGVAVENLIDGTPDDVRADVRQALEAGAKGRGFILGPSHSIAYGTKYDNFMALIDEYDKMADKYV